MASIKDVAEHAGVSTTTVSRVLSNPGAVRAPLRERVEQAIAALAYRPNLAARRLRQQRASLVGLIVSDIRSPFFTDVGRAVEDGNSAVMVVYLRPSDSSVRCDVVLHWKSYQW